MAHLRSCSSVVDRWQWAVGSGQGGSVRGQGCAADVAARHVARHMVCQSLDWKSVHKCSYIGLESFISRQVHNLPTVRHWIVETELAQQRPAKG